MSIDRIREFFRSRSNLTAFSMECSIMLTVSGNRVTLQTENMGIYIENTAVFKESVPENLYVALTGDQVALTDIRLDA